MSDFVLKSGKEINFNLDEMTYGQYLGIFDNRESDEKSELTIARVSGMSVKQLKGLSLTEYKRLLKALLKKAAEPLADPNSESASTSV